MQIVKKIVKNGTNTASVEATASAAIAAYVDENHTERSEDTSTLKSVVKITNLRAGDSYSLFIKTLANKRTDTGSNGSFSIKLPCQAMANHESELKQATENLHGQLDYILNEAYDKLPDDEKKKGQQIAEQNYLRLKMLGLMTNVSNASELIEAYLTEKGEVYIPQGPQLQLTVVGGVQTFEEQNDANQGWRQTTYTFKDNTMKTCYRRNCELFGRKRVPLSSTEQIEWAMDQVFQLAQSFENAFKGVSLSVDNIVSTFCEWAASLEHKDHKAEKMTLSEEKKKELDAKAATYVHDLMKIG